MSAHYGRQQVCAIVLGQIYNSFVVKFTKSSSLLQPAAERILLVSMFFLFAADVEAALVLCAPKISVFILALFITAFIHLAIVSVKTGLRGF